MRKTFIAAIVIVLVAVIAGAVLGYTYLQGQTQPTPSNPAQTTSGIENIRDQALAYVAANHTQAFSLMPTGHWSGGRVDQPGLVGAETYQFTNGNWQVEIHYPVVLNPIYTINCTAGGLTWSGTYQGGAINETACSIAADTTLTQEQMRDLTLMYLQGTHNETSSYMHDMSWTGGQMDMGMMVGSNKYNYMGNGWNVTIQNPVVPNPIYTVTAVYTPSNMHNSMMTWVGEIVNGTVTQTSYEYNP
jgi:hypothetical protein